MWEATRHDGEKKQSLIRETGSEQCMQSWWGQLKYWNGVFSGIPNGVGLPERWTGEQRPGGGGALALGTGRRRVSKGEEWASSNGGKPGVTEAEAAGGTVVELILWVFFLNLLKHPHRQVPCAHRTLQPREG